MNKLKCAVLQFSIKQGHKVKKSPSEKCMKSKVLYLRLCTYPSYL